MKFKFFIAGVLFALFGASVASAQVFGSVSGRLVDDKGKPIVGGQITITLANDPSAKPLTLDTDKKGTFTQDRIAPGTYQIRFFKEGLNPAVGTINVARGGSVNLGDIKLQPAPPDKTNAFKQAMDLVNQGKYDEGIAA